MKAANDADEVLRIQPSQNYYANEEAEPIPAKIISAVDEIPNIMDCSKINFNLLKAEINSIEKIELEDYTKKPSSQENTLVEFIGNKWMLHAASNIKASNDSFITKKDIYREILEAKI